MKAGYLLLPLLMFASNLFAQVMVIETTDSLTYTFDLSFIKEISFDQLAAIPPNSPALNTLGKALNNICPNPFNLQSVITYSVNEKSLVRIDVYNSRGKIITTLKNEFMDKGSYTLIWDGKDLHNTRVNPGAYFIRISSGDNAVVNKMMLVNAKGVN